MRSTGIRWPLAGLFAGTLCLALSVPPAIANSTKSNTSKDEVRVYNDGDDDDSGVRVYHYESGDDDAAPGNRKEIRVYSDNGDDDSKAPTGYFGVGVQYITR
ncbi:MAG: hypothetical protein ACRENN_07375 [Candidatus Eiseniibacteriota bacterium]